MRWRKLLNIELNRVNAEQFKTLPPSGIAVVLDNIRSAHNVGSVLRTADAFRADKVFLCGITPVPPTPEIHKVALGAEFSVDWEHCEQTLDAVARLHAEGWTVLSIEQTVGSLSLETFLPDPAKKYALVFGSEVGGVDQAVVDASVGVLEIPQFGTKHSLNISVSAGVVLWHFTLKKLTR